MLHKSLPVHGVKRVKSGHKSRVGLDATCHISHSLTVRERGAALIEAELRNESSMLPSGVNVALGGFLLTAAPKTRARARGSAYVFCQLAGMDVDSLH